MKGGRKSRPYTEEGRLVGDTGVGGVDETYSG